MAQRPGREDDYPGPDGCPSEKQNSMSETQVVQTLMFERAKLCTLTFVMDFGIYATV